MKTIVYRDPAARALMRHANKATLIRSKIVQYAENPASQSRNVTRLVGVDASRLRVQNFRVIFAETAAAIIILDIGPRGDIYDLGMKRWL